MHIVGAVHAGGQYHRLAQPSQFAEKTRIVALARADLHGRHLQRLQPREPGFVVGRGHEQKPGRITARLQLLELVESQIARPQALAPFRRAGRKQRVDVKNLGLEDIGPGLGRQVDESPGQLHVTEMRHPGLGNHQYRGACAQRPTGDLELRLESNGHGGGLSWDRDAVGTAHPVLNPPPRRVQWPSAVRA